MQQKAIVIIPARGGSKRFPRKNVALLNGRPLIGYAIAAAQKAEAISHVFVSTEDKEIADIAKRLKAEVPFLRPHELAGDRITADEAVADMSKKLRCDLGLDHKIVVLIQPTSPFILGSQIDAAVMKLIANPQWDSLTTMSEVDHRCHPYNVSRIQENGGWEFLHARERRLAKVRQDKPKVQIFCNLFAVRTETLETLGRFGKNKGSILLDAKYAWDIDVEWELKLAEFMINENLVDLSEETDVRRCANV